MSLQLPIHDKLAYTKYYSNKLYMELILKTFTTVCCWINLYNLNPNKILYMKQHSLWPHFLVNIYRNIIAFSTTDNADDDDFLLYTCFIIIIQPAVAVRTSRFYVGLATL